jgi:hypothetical protein
LGWRAEEASPSAHPMSVLQRKDAGVLSVDEEGTKFGFSGRGEDRAHDAADNMDGSVEWRSGGIGQMIMPNSFLSVTPSIRADQAWWCYP